MESFQLLGYEGLQLPASVPWMPLRAKINGAPWQFRNQRPAFTRSASL